MLVISDLPVMLLFGLIALSLPSQAERDTIVAVEIDPAPLADQIVVPPVALHPTHTI